MILKKILNSGQKRVYLVKEKSIDFYLFVCREYFIVFPLIWGEHSSPSDRRIPTVCVESVGEVSLSQGGAVPAGKPPPPLPLSSVRSTL